MQEISIRLYQGAYSTEARSERWLFSIALPLVGVQLFMLYRLAVLKDFHPAFLLLFLLNISIVFYFFLSFWLEARPEYRRHLTLSENGVRYRLKFMQQEQEFDWEEVYAVQLELFKVVFELKNEERHEVSLEMIQDDEALIQAKSQIRALSEKNNIEVT